MSDRPVVIDLAVEVSREEACRFLGYPEGRPASQPAAARLLEVWDAATAMLAPRGGWTVVDAEAAAAAGMPEPAPVVGVAVCTIGPALEAASGRAAAAGDLLGALVLDALGSAAAEAAADALNLELCALAERRDLVAAPRVSPGYGGWDTAGQRALLALLPLDEVGITLTAGAMMVPRKSVSFAVNFETAERAHGHAASRCARCGLVRCRHRVAPLDCG